MEEDRDPKNGQKSGGLQQGGPITNLDGCSLGVSRTGPVVQISITCAHDYAAIALYEQIVAASEQGYLSLKLEA